MNHVHQFDIILHSQVNDNEVNFKLQGSLSDGSWVTHQFLGLFQARASNMHNYFIHPVETSTHMHSNKIKKIGQAPAWNSVNIWKCMTTHLPLAFSTHSLANVFLSSTLRDMPSPVVPFTMAGDCAFCRMIKNKQANKQN